jgi:hypothetical protein
MSFMTEDMIWRVSDAHGVPESVCILVEGIVDRIQNANCDRDALNNLGAELMDRKEAIAEAVVANPVSVPFPAAAFSESPRYQAPSNVLPEPAPTVISAHTPPANVPSEAVSKA